MENTLGLFVKENDLKHPLFTDEAALYCHISIKPDIVRHVDYRESDLKKPPEAVVVSI